MRLDEEKNIYIISYQWRELVDVESYTWENSALLARDMLISLIILVENRVKPSFWMRDDKYMHIKRKRKVCGKIK